MRRFLFQIYKTKLSQLQIFACFSLAQGLKWRAFSDVRIRQIIENQYDSFVNHYSQNCIYYMQLNLTQGIKQRSTREWQSGKNESTDCITPGSSWHFLSCFIFKCVRLDTEWTMCCHILVRDVQSSLFSFEVGVQVV